MISIVIPVKNGIYTLGECLSGIRSQSLFFKTEIIVIDSGSSDGSIKFLQDQQDVRLYQIPPEQFNHGTTRNFGVSKAKGEFIVMTVQDATPADDKWLQKMVKHFENSDVAGVCGQQVVPHHKDKNPHQWFRPVSLPGMRKVKYNSADEFNALTPEMMKKECSWDDVNAMYRKSILEKIPFQHVPFSEDALWAKDTLSKGYTLIYDTSCSVYHYHFQTFDYTYKRTLTQLYYGYKFFGHKRKNTTNKFEYVKIFYRNIKYKASLKWFWHNVQIIRARDKAFNDFYSYLDKGDEAINSFYNKICTTTPQGTVQSYIK